MRRQHNAVSASAAPAPEPAHLSRRGLIARAAAGTIGLMAGPGLALPSAHAATGSASGLTVEDLDFQAALKPVDPEQGIFGVDDTYVWCGTPIANPSGGYYLFYSRWPHGSVGRDPATEGSLFFGFSGWLKYSEVAVAWSPSRRGPYRHVRTLLTGTGDESRWDRFCAHNPHVRRFGDRYYLYYIANNPLNTPEPWLSQQPTTWLRYHAGQRIGVVVADSLADLVEGRGRRSEHPIVAPDYVNTFQMVVNPSVTTMPDGRFLMTYKTWNAAKAYVNVVAIAESPEGPFVYQGVALEKELQAEDPYVWYDGERARFFAIVKDYYAGADRTKALTPQFGALGLVESTDGLKWRPAANPVVSLRTLRLSTDETWTLERLERPQLLLGEDGVPDMLHAAMSVGPPADGTQNVAIPLRF
ncbi:glycoside hydrolase family protein [Streptomyces sp. NPDC051940]|uniref:glycoside hydrolase family protein n=1 Tax=Streptomyces sp. NPDC051940 TaxID=3155675 RepID=UPI003436718B